MTKPPLELAALTSFSKFIFVTSRSTWACPMVKMAEPAPKTILAMNRPR